MNIRTLHEANRLRREAHLANDCPVLHQAADSAMRLLISEHNDALMLKRAQERAARASRPSRKSLPPGSLATLLATRIA